jgi:hypothetical protein
MKHPKYVRTKDNDSCERLMPELVGEFAYFSYSLSW